LVTKLKTDRWLLPALLIAPLALAVMSIMRLPDMWGLNHLAFMTSPMGIGLAVAFAFVVLFVTTLRPPAKLDALIVATDRRLFSPGIWPRVMVSLIGMVLFWQFRSQTHFLGDGYLSLSILGKGEGYLLKWTEPGAILAVRVIQWLAGGYTPETALLAFRILSVLSGGIVLLNSMVIANHLADSPNKRLLTLSTLWFSGTLLLWFGYVEYYPIFWAAASGFVALAIRSIRLATTPLAPLLIFLLAVFLHLQAGWMLPAVLYLTFRRHVTSVHVRLLAAAMIAGALLFVAVSSRSLTLATLFLPLVSGRPASPDYAIFSAKHLLDLLNLVVLVAPGILGLLALSWLAGPRERTNITAFLGLLAAGGTLFVFLIDPSLGMARDWDLFSFCVVPLALWLIAGTRSGNPVSGVTVLLYVITCAFLSVSFLAANLAVKPSEHRFESVLEHTGSKNRSGWGVGIKYYQDKRDAESARRVSTRMEFYFPEESKLREAYAALKERDYRKAYELARNLVAVDSLRSDYLQILGNVYGKVGEFDSAAAYYCKAVVLRPHSPTLKNELGQLYLNYQHYPEALAMLRSAHGDDPSLDFVMEGIGLTFARMNQPDSAMMIADSLFRADPHSPGAHLLALTVALQGGDSATASRHFQEFLSYGRSRSNYEALTQHYRSIGL
jgi:Tfp pilus assembly protein PilF